MYGRHKKLYRLSTFLVLCCVLFAVGSFFFEGEIPLLEAESSGGEQDGEEIASVYDSGDVSPPEKAERLTDENILKMVPETVTDRGMEFSTEGAIEPEKVETYLVVEKNEKIVIYFIDDFGAKQFIQQTDIPYGLLCSADQEMFRKGIFLDSLTEVFELLQDFES